MQLVADDYMTRTCSCKIRDVACLGCGNVIGYHVTQPCEPCLGACNNGHFWMFHAAEVAARTRKGSSGTLFLFGLVEIAILMSSSVRQSDCLGKSATSRKGQIVDQRRLRENVPLGATNYFCDGSSSGSLDWITRVAFYCVVAASVHWCRWLLPAHLPSQTLALYELQT